MKLIRSNGKQLEIWEIGSKPIYRLEASYGPIKCHYGAFILEDEPARELVQRLAAVQRDPEAWVPR